jgi:hypothetical protein
MSHYAKAKLAGGCLDVYKQSIQTKTYPGLLAQVGFIISGFCVPVQKPWSKPKMIKDVLFEILHVRIPQSLTAIFPI